MFGSKPGLSGTRFKPSKPVRIALQVAITAVFAGFGAYGFWAGDFVMPYTIRRTDHLYRQTTYLHFEGGSARILSAGLLIVTAGMVVLIINEINTEPGSKADKTLPGTLVLTGFVMMSAMYAAKLFHVL